VSSHTPTAWEDPRRVLKRHGLRPSHRLSQCFLVSPHAIERIVAAVAPQQGQLVVELGPGLGTLTFALARAGARLIAIERDPRMVGVLEQERGALPVQVIEGDATRVDYAAYVEANDTQPVVVGNIPYAVTGAILRSLIDARMHVAHAVLMMQREVRDRLVAKPSTADYGVLSIFAANAFEIETVMHVPRTSFFPSPRVDSSVVSMRPRAQPLAAQSDAFGAIVHAAFSTRRKTLRNALSRLPGGAERLEHAFTTSGIDPSRRGETLSIEEFATLAQAWSGTSP